MKNITQRYDPWRRTVVTSDEWDAAAAAMATGSLTLVALWGDADIVHMSVHDQKAGEFAVLSVECNDGTYPSVSKHHPPALRPERALRDLFGLQPQGLPDERPWLDHGRWGLRYPMQSGGASAATAPPRYEFLKADGENLHQIPVGPVHAGIIEPGHFRFTASGETVVRLEERLGYVHKGIEHLMKGADLNRGAMLAGRTSGDSTVAYAVAFARAAEAALDATIPQRAHWIRALMAELERIANHLGDFGAICNDASFAIIHTHCGILRERVLRAADSCFGHRLMRDRVVPGGVTVDLHSDADRTLRDLVKEMGTRFPALVELYDDTASLQDRTVGTGVLQQALAEQYGAGGYVGRASGRGFDARKTPGYAPYDVLNFNVPVLEDGDVNARVWVRVKEIEQSLSLVIQILEQMPSGATRADLRAPSASREGVALIEGFRGDVLAWLRIAPNGLIERCHLRDPSVFQWPLLEAAIYGNIVADFPLCNKSFNCSYSGHDL